VQITTGAHIRSIDELPPARAYVFDTSAQSLLQIAGDRLYSRYIRALQRQASGNAVSKVDFIVSEPIPWIVPELGQSGTVHLGGISSDIRRAEWEIVAGKHPEQPFVVLSQPSVFDPSRSPAGTHSVWAYAHVPAGSTLPQVQTISAAIEKAAPGFRDTIIDTRATTAAEIAERNPTMTGGDFASGAITTRQIIARPVLSTNPWKAGDNIFLCSAATAPGPGVHGMSGHNAAKAVLQITRNRQ